MPHQTIIVGISHCQVQKWMHDEVQSHHHGGHWVLIYGQSADLGSFYLFAINDQFSVVLLNELLRLLVLGAINA